MVQVDYTIEILRTWRPSRLTNMYMNWFNVSRSRPEYLPQFEVIVETLRLRQFWDRWETYRILCRETDSRSSDIESLRPLVDMLNYYTHNVLGRGNHVSIFPHSKKLEEITED